LHAARFNLSEGSVISMYEPSAAWAADKSAEAFSDHYGLWGAVGTNPRDVAPAERVEIGGQRNLFRAGLRQSPFVCGHSLCDPLPKLNRTLGARRRELYDAKVATLGNIGVEPPTQASVKSLGPLDVRNRNGDDLELEVDRSRG
jgi:hypothetical protein